MKKNQKLKSPLLILAHIAVGADPAEKALTSEFGNLRNLREREREREREIDRERE